MSRRKSELYITLSLIHLALAVVAIVVISNLESPWRGILFTAVFVSLLIWPTKSIRRICQGGYKKEEQKVLG